MLTATWDPHCTHERDAAPQRRVDFHVHILVHFGVRVRDRRKAVSAFRGHLESWDVRANVYVDGFSLYSAALRRTPYKWLDLRKLSKLLLPNDRIRRIRYFTAIPIFEWNDVPQGQRLQAYVRALETLRGVTVHYGTCRAESGSLPVPGSRTEREFVIARRAKGSDVNLATMLLADGFRGDYEVAVVVSSDSDLALPMRIVRRQLQLPVGLLKPGDWYANELVRAATFWKPIREGVLATSQLPAQLSDEHGTITKPSAW